MSLRTVSFSMTADEYALFAVEARCKGQTVSGYCKTAAFSHLAKYGSKALFSEIITMLKTKREDL